MKIFHIILSLPLLLAACAAKPEPDTVQYVSPYSEKLTPRQFSSDHAEAMKGNVLPAWRLGRHYLFDNKPELALRWFRMASILGKEDAMDSFFIVTQSIKTIDDLDRLEAKLWLAQACEKGYEPSINTRKAHQKYGNAW